MFYDENAWEINIYLVRFKKRLRLHIYLLQKTAIFVRGHGNIALYSFSV